MQQNLLPIRASKKETQWKANKFVPISTTNQAAEIKSWTTTVPLDWQSRTTSKKISLTTSEALTDQQWVVCKKHTTDLVTWTTHIQTPYTIITWQCISVGVTLYILHHLYVHFVCTYIYMCLINNFHCKYNNLYVQTF